MAQSDRSKYLAKVAADKANKAREDADIQADKAQEDADFQADKAQEDADFQDRRDETQREIEDIQRQRATIIPKKSFKDRIKSRLKKFAPILVILFAVALAIQSRFDKGIAPVE